MRVTVYDERSHNVISRRKGMELLGTGGYNTDLLRNAYRDILGYHDDFMQDFPCDSLSIQSVHDIDPIVLDVGPLNNLFKVTYPHDLEFLGVIQRKIKK